MKKRRIGNGRIKSAPCQGWTLTELMICLALMGVLATLAIPSFQQQQRQARRHDGQASLMQIQLDQARWRSTHESHADSLTDLGWPSDQSAQGHYQISLAQASAEGYVVQAVGQGAQANDRACNPLRLRWVGTASPVFSAGEHLDSDPTGCWKK